MRLLRWIFGIPLALVISCVINLIFNYFDTANSIFYGHASLELFCHSFIQMASAFLLVFLSCLFIPSNKRVAAIVAALIVFALTVLIFYFNVTDSLTYGQFTFVTLINDAARIAGVLLGIYVSYEMFKDKGWRPDKIPV